MAKNGTRKLNTFAVLSTKPSFNLQRVEAILNVFLEDAALIYDPEMIHQSFKQKDGIFTFEAHPSQRPKPSNKATRFDTCNLRMLLGTPVFSTNLPETGNPPADFTFEGNGAIITSDPSAIEIRTDRFGSYPIYQSKGPRGVAFSNRAVLAIALSGNRVIFDEENLLELIATEGNLGQGEIFKSVRRLPAAKYVCIKGSEKISERTNEKMETDVQNPCDMDFAIHKMTEFICLAQKQYGEIVCKLTGGYDSRLNLALMKNANVTFKCFTRIPVEESEIAISLSKKLGLPHILEKRSPSLNVNIEPVSLNEGMSLPKALKIQIPPSPMFVSGAGGEFNRL
ncbi:hypothetical protein N9B60_06645, partial [Mariniblastus sp.]|nr:hypothetical protein [Mariniblastus sp.]